MALLYASHAQASSLYRCIGGSGETVYSSSKAGYRGCQRQSYFGPVSKPRAPAARASLALVPSFTSVRAVAETSAREPEPPPSLRNVLAAVETSARLPTPIAAVPPVKPGTWNYSESALAAAMPGHATSGNATAGAAPAKSPGDGSLRGSVYRVVRADGSVEYTNVQPQGRRNRVVTMLFSYIVTCVACNLHSPINWNTVPLKFDMYAMNIRAASLEFGVDEAFVRAIIHAESAYNSRALSLKGAQGLMQLMPGTAGDMGVRDAFDAEQNIRGGTRYLALLLRNFNGNEQLAAAAYNAGAAAVARYNGVPPYAETQVYVERVGALRRRYGNLLRPPLAFRGPG